MECINKAIALNPHYVFALCNKGLTLDYQNNQEEAARFYENAKKMSFAETQKWWRAIHERHRKISTLKVVEPPPFSEFYL